MLLRRRYFRLAPHIDTTFSRFATHVSRRFSLRCLPPRRRHATTVNLAHRQRDVDATLRLAFDSAAADAGTMPRDMLIRHTHAARRCAAALHTAPLLLPMLRCWRASAALADCHISRLLCAPSLIG